MSKRFTLKATYLNGLAGIVLIEPKELTDLFPETDLVGVHKHNKLKDEILEANVLFSDAVAALNKALRPIQERFKNESKELDEANKAQLLTKLNDELEKLPESAALKEVSDKDVEVTIGSNERFDLLKSIFAHKKSIAKWSNSKALVAVDDALNAAVKVD